MSGDRKLHAYLLESEAFGLERIADSCLAPEGQTYWRNMAVMTKRVAAMMRAEARARATDTHPEGRDLNEDSGLGS